ncbi:MAG: tetratricopeptide repeat protein [Planctomycetes bacterium]|nr:tetratricopeptide repeat protein [Planctomycetota bacterium]
MPDKAQNSTIRRTLDQAGEVFAQGRLDEAQGLLRQVLQLDGACAEAHHNLGLVHARRSDWPAAAECFSRAAELSPGNAGAINNLAKAYFCAGKHDLAVRNFARAIALDEKSVGACRGMGQTLAAMGEFEDAVEYLRRALAQSPADIETLSSLGAALGRLGRRAEEADVFGKVVATRPDYAEGHNNLGNSLYCVGQFRPAEECYLKAVSLKPALAEAKFNLSLLQLLEGRFADGWANFEARYDLADLTCLRPDAPRWDGRGLAGGTLLVRHEQGFGDSIHFVRYLPMARQRCGRLVFGCPKELRRLFAGLAGVDEWVENYAGVKYDATTGLLSLPGLFGTNLNNIPAAIPYLRADQQRSLEFKRMLPAGKLNVGLAWSGHPNYARNHERAMRLWDYGPVLETQGAALHSLQIGGRADEIERCPDLQIRDWSGELKDFADTAALIDALDVVITTDTAVAHLAGAMGKAVWVLLCLVPDWRWLIDRPDCPWYPTMRLFRQKSYGDWASVAAAVAGELAKMADAWKTQPAMQSQSTPADDDDLAGLPVAQLLARAGMAFEMGNMDEAMRCYGRALTVEPENFQALFNMGVLLQTQEQLPQAAEYYSKAVSIVPQSPQGQCNLGCVMARIGRLDEAAAAYAAFAAISPGDPMAHGSLAGALFQLKKYEQAAEAFQKALNLRPDQPNDWCNLGLCMEKTGRLDRAQECYRKAISLKGDFAEAVCNLAGVMLQLERPHEARDLYQRATSIKPDMPNAFWGLGNILLKQGDLAGAERMNRRAVELAPDNADANWNLSIILLLTGKFEEGWRRYAFRRQVGDFGYPPVSSPLWDGRPMPDGTLLVVHEQGFGDTIQFARYVRLARRRCGRLALSCHPQLAGLFRRLAGADEIVADLANVRCDSVVWLLDLPGIFKTDLSNIPADVPYLRAPDEKAKTWRDKMAGGMLNVGLAWSGNPKFAADQTRSTNLETFAVLAGASGAAFHSLQVGPLAGQAKSPPAGMRITDWSEQLKDFSDTAGLIANLDLVITTDTAVAHLAGAMGKPTWVLLGSPPDWRWLLDRPDCPWYPTMRLFRQEKPGDWSGPAAKIADELRRLAAGGGRSHSANREIPSASADRPGPAEQPAGAPAFIAELVDQAQQFSQSGRHDQAAAAYQKILEIEPGNTLALNNLGVIEEKTGRFDQAGQYYARAVRADPKFADGHYNLGMVHLRMGRPELAEQEYRQAVAINPGFFEAHNNLGTICLRTGRFGQALEYYQRAAAIQPGSTLAIGNCGKALYKLGRLDEAEKCYERVLAQQPGLADIRASNSLIRLLKGDYRRGLAEYEARYDLPEFNYVAALRPRWDGSAMPDKTLLVCHEQGLGDTIQFARYLPQARRRCGRLILCCPNTLMPLLKSAAGIDEVVGDAGQARYDAAIGIVSLPWIFGATPETASVNAAYLRADPARSAAWRQRIPRIGLNVGLAWAGDPRNRRDTQRSLELSALDALCEARGAAFHSLQVGPAADQIGSGKLKIADWSAMLTDFAETAALTDNLDLVVTVDTAAAHLAGSMGKPVWIILPTLPDWRWMLDRPVSPWYPSARLFRQAKSDDWSKPLSEIVSELRKLIEKAR